MIHYPRFIKLSMQQKLIDISMKQLVSLFFDVNTAKNFEYVNLLQNDQIRTGAVKGQRKGTSALCVKVQQMQKKNLINGLFSNLKCQASSTGLMVRQEQNPDAKKQMNNSATELPPMSV